jgi:hypothetical protein
MKKVSDGSSSSLHEKSERWRCGTDITPGGLSMALHVSALHSSYCILFGLWIFLLGATILGLGLPAQARRHLNNPAQHLGLRSPKIYRLWSKQGAQNLKADFIINLPQFSPRFLVRTSSSSQTWKNKSVLTMSVMSMLIYQSKSARTTQSLPCMTHSRSINNKGRILESYKVDGNWPSSK